MPYVPLPADDELLYSWAARIARINRLGAPRAALAALFGCSSVTPHVDLPVHLQALWERTEGLFGSVSAMIEEATLYPYYRPFSARSHDLVLRAMTDGRGGAFRMAMGHTANAFGIVPELRVCPECVRSDLKNWGFAYWHRAHHLPGVRVCHEHLTLLVPTRGIERKWSLEFVLPPRRAGEIIGCLPPRQIEFSGASSELLRAALPPLDPARFSLLYLTALHARGLARFRSGELKPDCHGIASSLRHHYGDFVGFVHRARLLRSERMPLQWVRSILTRPMVASHPVCHLLLWLWLYGSVQAFVRVYLDMTSSQEQRVVPKPITRPKEVADIQQRRRLWIEALEMNGTAKPARAVAGATYAWLYRNDRNWLLATNARVSPDRPRALTVDWTARDADLCIQARSAAAEMQAQHPNQRLTASRIRRVLGEAMVTRNAGKLPLLNQLLGEVAESSEEYHRRRVLRVLESFKSSSKSLTWSKVQRAAGLRKWNPTLCVFTTASVASLGLSLAPREGESDGSG